MPDRLLPSSPAPCISEQFIALFEAATALSLFALGHPPVAPTQVRPGADKRQLLSNCRLRGCLWSRLSRPSHGPKSAAREPGETWRAIICSS